MRDASGFDEFYRSTAAATLRYAHALTGDHGEAQDAVQEAYTRAWRRWRTLAEHPAPAAWVRLVVTRLTADRWRRIFGLRDALVRSGPSPPARPPSEETVLLISALRELPHTQRQALALHYLFDLPIEQIAAETGVAAGTVKSWLSRGRNRLATVLSELAPDGNRDDLREVNDAG